MKPAIIVHGGAHPVPHDEIEAHCRGCLAGLEAGWNILSEGGSAIDAIEAAVRALEDDPTFNAGYGSELNAVGEVETDAAMMEGSNLAAGGVGALQGVRHPVSAARRVLESDSVLLVAQGAHEFAARENVELCDPSELVAPKQREKWEKKQSTSRGHDTVGAVAIDANGNVAAATSTGGTNANARGRIGDSPIIGCGLYADNQAGACALTGDGESITRVVLAKTIIDLLREGWHPDEAAQRAIQTLEERAGGEGGCIVIDAQGRIGWAHNAENLPCAYFQEGMLRPVSFVHKRDERTSEIKD